MDASASGAGAPQQNPTVTVIPKDPKATLDVVVQQLAEKKREELGNTQKFFKKDVGVVEAAKENTKVTKGTTVGEEIDLEKIPHENPKEAEVETTEEQKSTDEGTTKEASKEAEPAVTNEPKYPAAIAEEPDATASDAPASDAPALKELAEAATKSGARASKAAALTPIEKNLKIKLAPTRSNSRLKSGAKKE